ncbi:MAG: murein hydrolase activator EnvC family protein [Culicoidibacterales bacterium]
MQKKFKIFTSILAVTLLLTCFAPAIQAVACDSIEACKLQLETLKQQNSQAQAQLEASEDDLDAAKQRVEQTQNLIFGIDDEINSYDQTITMLEAEIENLTTIISQLQAELAEKDAVLRNRLVDLQLRNKVNPYLSFLSNASSLTDFIARNEAILLLNDYDQELMIEVGTKRAEIETQKQEVEKAQIQTEELKIAADQRRGEQETLLAQLEVEKTNYEQVVVVNAQKIEDINLSAGVVDEQLATLIAIQEQIKKEQEEAANKPKPEGPSEEPGNPDGDGDGGGGSLIPPTQQGFVIPTARGYISCQFMCTDYVNDKGHLGTDIAAPTGTPTYAITDGYVILVKDEASSGGFGNMIAITHVVNGVEMVSIYGHLSSIGVGVGQRVSAGEYIGAVGNTGQSTGPHLHLELLYGIGYMPALRDERAMYAVDSAGYIAYPGSW